MMEKYKEIKLSSGTSTFRKATDEEIKESEAIHKDGGCDAGYCEGIFTDHVGFIYDMRCCAICHKFIGLV